MELHPAQQQAVELCLDQKNRQRTLAISGAAGTGKTTIIRYVYDLLIREGRTVVLCAPTGKAARRITQSSGIPAVTIHKLLEYPRPGERDPDTGKPLDTGEPKRRHDNPLGQDVILADEYAMVSYELDRNLIDAMKRGGRLIVFGDQHQLDPIEPAYIRRREESPFNKMMRLNCVRLTHVFRQGEGSGILYNADRIRRGSIPVRTDDFRICFAKRHPAVLKDYVLANQEAGVDFRSLDNQIIVPERKSWIGTHKLNCLMRDCLNPDTLVAYRLPRHTWDEQYPVIISQGDKVVCTENTYDMRDYTDRYASWEDRAHYLPEEWSFIPTPDSKTMLNGETGLVYEIFPDGMIHIDMGDRIVEVPAQFDEYSRRHKSILKVQPAKRLELAYALTTHKCQGSEYDNVVYMMSRSVAYMLERKNFYTAVTRAKQNVQLITDEYALKIAMREERPVYIPKVLA